MCNSYIPLTEYTALFAHTYTILRQTIFFDLQVIKNLTEKMVKFISLFTRAQGARVSQFLFLFCFFISISLMCEFRTYYYY